MWGTVLIALKKTMLSYKMFKMQRGYKAYQKPEACERRGYFQCWDTLEKAKHEWLFEGWYIWNVGTLGSSTSGEGMKMS